MRYCERIGKELLKRVGRPFHKPSWEVTEGNCPVCGNVLPFEMDHDGRSVDKANLYSHLFARVARTCDSCYCTTEYYFVKEGVRVLDANGEEIGRHFEPFEIEPGVKRSIELDPQ